MNLIRFKERDIMKLFNFHTHNTREEFGIINVNSNSDISPNKQYSIGLHPWDYELNYTALLSEMKNISKSKNIVAIGETGFDPKSKLDISVQKEIFTQHVQLSEDLQKPLIIHCVKYYNELIEIKLKLNPKQKWILHGFRGKSGVANSLLKNGLYFSINEDILKNGDHAVELICLMRKDRIFLETDDLDTSIENIYNFVAKTFEIDKEELHKIIQKNIKTIGL